MLCSFRYGVAVQDFGKSWTSGLAFLAVIKSIDTSLVDMRRALLRTPRENIEEAFRTAHYSLGIPRLLEPEGKYQSVGWFTVAPKMYSEITHKNVQMSLEQSSIGKQKMLRTKFSFYFVNVIFSKRMNSVYSLFWPIPFGFVTIFLCFWKKGSFFLGFFDQFIFFSGSLDK